MIGRFSRTSDRLPSDGDQRVLLMLGLGVCGNTASSADIFFLRYSSGGRLWGQGRAGG